LLLLLTATAGGQDTVRKYYVQRSVNGTLNRITIGGGTRALQLGAVYYQCSVECAPFISKKGTVAGGSSGASILKQLDERGPATPTFTVTLDGTVSSATTVFDPPVNTAASGERLHKGGLTLPVTAQNIMTFELVSSSTGNLYIYVEVYEL